MEVVDVLMGIVGASVLIGAAIVLVKLNSNAERIEAKYQSTNEQKDVFVKKYKEATVEYYKGPIVKMGVIAIIGVLILAFNVTGKQLATETENPTIFDEDFVDIIETPQSQHFVERIAPPETPIENPVIDIIENDIDIPEVVDPIDEPIQPPVENQPLEFTSPLAPESDIKDLDVPEYDETEPIFISEIMPEFPGGEDALFEYLAKNVKYPSIAQENGITGRVVLRFVVDENGDIDGIEVLRDIGGGCGNEAVKVVSKMPKWSPGLQGGRAVKVYYTLPFTFRLGWLNVVFIGIELEIKN